jgi:transposase-like protein
LSKDFGLHVSTIRYRFRDRNVQFRSRAEYTKIGKARVTRERFPPELIETIIAAYLGGKSVYAISRETGVNHGVIYGWLRNRRLMRDGSTASRLMYSRLTVKQRKRFTAVANASNVGRIHPVEGLQRRAATRQKELTVASPTEFALSESLRGLGYTVIPQRCLGIYNLDIALEECRVSVEVQHRRSNPHAFLARTEARKRLEYVLGQGWSILFVTIRGKGFVFPDIVQKVLAFCELASRNKSSRGQYGMIRSDGKHFTKSRLNPDGFSCVSGF